MDESSSGIFSKSILKNDLPSYQTGHVAGSMTCWPQALSSAFLRPFHSPDMSFKMHVDNENDCITSTAHKSLTLKGFNGKLHMFPIQTFLPKVQLNRIVPRKQCPRDVEIDRRRRLYEKTNLNEMLNEAKLPSEELLPTKEQYASKAEYKFKHFLPLDIFDDTEFYLQSPEAWIHQGNLGGVQYALPALSFLPDLNNWPQHLWQYVAVYNYEKNRQLWHVMVLETELEYDVPSVQVMFLAENPNMFVKRIKHAVENRNDAENLLQLNCIIDCAVLQSVESQYQYSNKLVDKLISKMKGNEGCLTELRKEVYILFERLMAFYEFEKHSKFMLKVFPDVPYDLLRRSLPKLTPATHSVIERADVKTLKLDMKIKIYDVLKNILYYTPAAIDAMENISVECQYVLKQNLFLLKTQFTKPQSLHDFLQEQIQHNNIVCSYLCNFWPQNLSHGIVIVLRPLGKGWLDTSLESWSVYQMCKISRFMLLAKLRMQEAIEGLLSKSMEKFVSFVTSPCEQFLSLQPNYKWTSDFIETDFPCSRPIFSIVIGVSEDKQVIYSTPPEEFRMALCDIFRHCLEKTNAIRHIDAETLVGLRFSPNLYIFTVELIEDKYIMYNDFLNKCYSQAVIPLHAYAKLYERFIEFYLINVNDYIREYAEINHTSSEVRRNILEHKQQKEELRAILPSTIVIGPFIVNVDPMKAFMIQKHTEIVKRLFEYYIQRMYDINDRLLEKCIQTYTKIAEPPRTIEHLYEIRDFAQHLPMLVEQLKAAIQIMFLEYEVLDNFYYNLSDQQFSMKWETYAWPYKILIRLSTLRDEQNIDKEQFLHKHFSECGAFEERLEALNGEIQAYSLYFDATKVVEISVEVKKTWKNITDAQVQGELLKMRQKLFGLDDYSLEFLESIINGFTPYRILWSTGGDFVKLEEATIGNPIANIELEEVCNTLMTIRTSLKETAKLFAEKEKIQNVAKAFLDKIKRFIPIFKCLGWLKNEYWLHMHWQELATQGEMDIKYSPAINFLYLIRKGILEHLDLVHKISVNAKEEAFAYKKKLEEEERLREEKRRRIELRKAMRKCRTDIL